MRVKFTNYILGLLPNFLWPLERYILRKRFRKIGKNVVFYNKLSRFINPENIEIGNDVFINSGFYCSNEKLLIIHDRVMFGANVSIIAGDHLYSNPNVNMRFSKILGVNRQIIIEQDAWIGHGTFILKNSFIGEGCIIGANSLINSHLKPYSVYAGNPLKFIKPRFKTYEELLIYLNMMKSSFHFETKYNLEDLRSIYQ